MGWCDCSIMRYTLICGAGMPYEFWFKFQLLHLESSFPLCERQWKMAWVLGLCHPHGQPIGMQNSAYTTMKSLGSAQRSGKPSPQCVSFSILHGHQFHVLALPTSSPAAYLHTEKAAEADPGPWAPKRMWETWKKHLAPGIRTAPPWLRWPFEEWTSGWKVSLCLFPSVESAFPVKIRFFFF